MKGTSKWWHFTNMKPVCCVPLLFAIAAWADEAERSAIDKVIVTFNHTHERQTVVASDADLSDLEHFRGQEVSQMYFELKSVYFVTRDAAVADAVGSQFGSPGFKRTVPALFILKRVGTEWKVVMLRLAGSRMSG